MDRVLLEAQPAVAVHRVGDVDEQRVRHGVAAEAHQRVDDLLGVVPGGAGVPQAERREAVGVHVLGRALELGERRDRHAGTRPPAGGRPRAAGSCRTGRSAGRRGVHHRSVQRRRGQRASERSRGLVVDVGHAGDAVQREGAVLLAQVVAGGRRSRPRRRAARRRARSPGPARRRSRARPGGARGRPTAGRPACPRVVDRVVVTGARRAARAARSPARRAVTDSAACSAAERSARCAGAAAAAAACGGPRAGQQQRAVGSLGGRRVAGGAQQLRARCSSGDRLTRTVGASRRSRSGAVRLAARTSDSSASSSQRT